MSGYQMGEFVADPCGVIHYRYLWSGWISTAAEDALSRWRDIAGHSRAPAWFWFNGSPAPHAGE